MRPYTIIVFLLLAVTSCQQNRSMTGEQKEKIITDIRQTMENYYSDIKTSGLTAEFKYLDSSSQFFWVPPGYASAISYDSVKKILTRSAPHFKLADNTFDTLRIIPLTNELATYTAKIHSAMTDTAGIITKVILLETGVLIKRKDGWKLLNGQTAVMDK